MGADGGGKRYSAGAIFLQVVPVFANVQRQIADEAKEIDRALGDSMEKSGEKAGERAGKAASKKLNEELKKGSGEFEREFHKNIDGINRALGGIDTKKLSNDLRRELSEVKKELAGLKSIDITAEADFKRVYADLAVLEGRTRGIRDNAKIVFRADIDNALKGFAKVQAAKEAIDDPVEIEVRADTSPAERAMGAFEKSMKKSAERAGAALSGAVRKDIRKIKAELDDLQGKRVGIDISGAMARREIQRLSAELLAISQNDVDVDVRVDTGEAYTELIAFETALQRIDGQNVKVDIDVDEADNGVRRLGRSGDQAANSFRSFNIILFAAATAGPALVPVLAAIAGGLLALGPAAGVAVASIGAVMVGFSGIGGALQALGNQQDQAAMTAQTAARSEASAAKAVASARRSAARQIESALDRQRDAQKRYQESIQDVKEAEEALRDARRAARDDGAELDRAIRENALAIDQGLLDSFNATVTFNGVMADGSATNAEQEQARINMEEAKLRLEELRAEQKQLAADKKKWDKDGVNGAEEVQSAQERLNDAIDSQREAYEALGEAARGVDEARADGARAVKDALDSQAEALQGVNAQQNAVDQAFGKMGKSGKAFTLFLFGLRDEFRNFRNDVQDVLLPSVQDAIEGFMGSKSGGVARSALIALADSFGRFVQALSVSFQGQAWMGFFQMLGDIGPDIQDAWGGAFIALLEALASILTTTAPFALEFARGLENMMQAFADWAASEAGQQGILDFLAYVKEVAPDVLDFIGAFAHFAVAIARALGEWGDVVLQGLTGFFEVLADLDPTLLAALVTGLVILIASSQTAYAVMNLLMAGAALLGSTVGIWVFAIAGIAAALAYLYTKNEDFRDFINKAWDQISRAVMDAWEDWLKPALEDLGAAMKDLWDEILQPFFEWLGPILLWYVKTALPLLMKWWAFLATAIAWAITEVIIPAVKLWWSVWGPIFRAIGRVALWLWEKVIEPFIEYVKKEWPKWAVVIESVWKKKIKPVFERIGEAVGGVRKAFRNAIEGIKSIWSTLGSIISAPVRFVVNTILRDGLIAGLNKVLKFVGKDQISFPGIKETPKSGGASDVGRAFATGGILPGYSPGVDNHRFYSRTAGTLDLSGGEAIMRPEWTKAIGPGMVDYWNGLARRGGVKAVRSAMMGGQAFASGGVYWPLPGGSASTYKGHDGVDLNAPNDNGKPFYSATKGFVTSTGYNRGYGNAVFVASPFGELVYGHAQDGSIQVVPGQKVRPGTMLARVGSTGNSSGPHLHFGFPGGTYAGAMALLSGAAQIPAGDIKKAGQPKFPTWILDVARNPLGYVKDLVQAPIKAMKDKFSDDSSLTGALLKLPGRLVGDVGEKIGNMIPAPVKAAAKGGSKIADAATDIAGMAFARGGILPYNGTMMYDDGGYLPPGMTTVMNLTGKPEPVFTNDQWSNMGKGGEGGTLHYEPHFEGSNLTSEDVASDLNFTFRRIRRGGKYAGVGDQ